VGLESATLLRNRNRSLVYGWLGQPSIHAPKMYRGSSYLPKARAWKRR